MSHLEPPAESPTQQGDLPQQFECQVRPSGRDAIWIRAYGELDLASASRFEQVLHESLSRALLVVVDLRRLSFIDSTGIHAIIEADASARRSEQQLAFVRGPSQIDRLFELVGLSDRLAIVDPEAAFDRAPSPLAPSEAKR